MLSVEIKENDNVVGMLTAAEKLFKTGSRGFFGMGKIQNRRKTIPGAGAVGGDRFETEDGGEGFEGWVMQNVTGL